MLAVIILLFFISHIRGCFTGLFHLGSGPVTAGAGDISVKPGNVEFPAPGGKREKKRKSPDANADLTPLPKGGTQVDVEEFGFVLDPLIGITWANNPFLPAAGARLMFIGPDIGAQLLAEVPMDSRAGLHLGPDFRIGNFDFSAGIHQPYQSFLNTSTLGISFSASVFPFDPPGKTILHTTK